WPLARQSAGDPLGQEAAQARDADRPPPPHRAGARRSRPRSPSGDGPTRHGGGGEMRVLITGTGRCGTGWMARALTAAGAPCGHEAAFTARRHGDCDWVAESSWLAAPYLDRLDGVYVVHLVRDPLKTIALRAATPTFRPRLTFHGRFAVHHAPDILRGHDRVERSAWHWECWTRIITYARADEALLGEDLTGDVGAPLPRVAVADPACLTRHRPAIRPRQLRLAPPTAGGVGAGVACARPGRRRGLLRLRGGPVIPEIVHVIWIGPRFFPYADFLESWSRHNPGWQVRLWTDENRPHLGVNEQIYRRLPAQAMRADLLRLHLLAEYGGLYSDADSTCLAPVDLLEE